jgi:Trypsin-like peptidase domain
MLRKYISLALKQKIITKVIASTLIVTVLCQVILRDSYPDSYFINRAVRIVNAEHSCSGEQIIAPSGKEYILTAGHCRAIADKDGNVKVILENGAELQRRIIAEDPTSDLLLIEGLPNLSGIYIANNAYRRGKIKTYTSGGGLATYRTDGEIAQLEKQLMIGLYIIETPEQEAGCHQEKNDIYELPFLGIKICILSVIETAITAPIVPGSSGGMVVNESGQLIGVVSAGGGDSIIGYTVTLDDIKDFLAGY